MGENQLKKQAFSGLIWTSIEALGARFISLFIQIILARLLIPKDFGIIGMITVFIAVAQTLLDSGLQNALIREKEVTDKDYSTVFYFNLLMAFFLYIILYASAPHISSFYKTPILSGLLRILGLVLFINSFGLVQRTMLTRELNFKIQTKIILISSTLSGIIAIILAFLGFGVWSLVIQQILSQLFQSTLFMLNNRWFPKSKFDFFVFKKYFSFGWKLTLSGIINTLYQNIFYVIIGKFYSSTDLGYYTNSQKFNDIPVQSMTQAIQKVTYPLLSQVNAKGDDLKGAYRKVIRYSAAASFMMMIALSASANNLIPLVFGKNWINSVPYFQILCFGGMLYPINAINLNILQVKGRSDLFLKLEVIKKIIGIAFIVVAIFFKTGIIGLVWAGVLATIFNTSLNIIVSANLINYSYFEQLQDLYKFFFTAVSMGVLMFFIGTHFNYSKLLTLFFQYLFGLSSYILIGKYIFKIPEIDIVFNFILKKTNMKR